MTDHGSGEGCTVVFRHALRIDFLNRSGDGCGSAFLVVPRDFFPDVGDSVIIDWPHEMIVSSIVLRLYGGTYMKCAVLSSADGEPVLDYEDEMVDLSRWLHSNGWMVNGMRHKCAELGNEDANV